MSTVRLTPAEREAAKQRKKERGRAYAARKKAERRKAGLCVDCGIVPPKEAGIYCGGCLRKQRKALVKLAENRLDAKLCRRCGRPGDRDKRICSRCLNEERAKYALRKKHRLCVKCGQTAVKDKIHCERCIIGVNRRTARFKERVKDEVLRHYGNGRIACVCCGESAIVFLTIDHIDGGGAKHRRELDAKNSRGGGGYGFYAWLRRMGLPSGYQVLCFNCNFAKWKLGRCPHQEKNEQT